jgi:hypothetical protein
MNRLRTWLAAAGLAAATVAGVVLLPAPNVDPRQDLVERVEQNGRGRRVHVLWNNANGMPSNLCDGIDCELPDGGPAWTSQPERALCEQKGHGLTRKGRLDGLYLDAVPAPLTTDLADGGVSVDGCVLLMRQQRAQIAAQRRLFAQEQDGTWAIDPRIVETDAQGNPTVDGSRARYLALNRWATILNVRGYGDHVADLPAPARRAAQAMRWAGHPTHDLSDENDAGVIPDGGEPL